MEYVEQLFNYNKDENGVIEIDDTVLETPKDLQDYIIGTIESNMSYDHILEFNFDDFVYDYANTNLDNIQEQVNMLTEFVSRVSHGGTPLVSLCSVIIKHWLDKIKETIQKEKI